MARKKADTTTLKNRHAQKQLDLELRTDEELVEHFKKKTITKRVTSPWLVAEKSTDKNFTGTILYKRDGQVVCKKGAINNRTIFLFNTEVRNIQPRVWERLISNLDMKDVYTTKLQVILKDDLLEVPFKNRDMETPNGTKPTDI
jgi:hypothetical protein